MCFLRCLLLQQLNPCIAPVIPHLTSLISRHCCSCWSQCIHRLWHFQFLRCFLYISIGAYFLNYSRLIGRTLFFYISEQRFWSLPCLLTFKITWLFYFTVTVLEKNRVVCMGCGFVFITIMSILNATRLFIFDILHFLLTCWTGMRRQSNPVVLPIAREVWCFTSCSNIWLLFMK